MSTNPSVGHVSSVAPSHTPGPWHRDEDGEPNRALVCSEDYTVADCGIAGNHAAEANARLIAAAPELLEALKAATEALNLAQAQLGGEAMCKHGPLVEFCRTALAKAERGQ